MLLFKFSVDGAQWVALWEKNNKKEKDYTKHMKYKVKLTIRGDWVAAEPINMDWNGNIDLKMLETQFSYFIIDISTHVLLFIFYPALYRASGRL